MMSTRLINCAFSKLPTKLLGIATAATISYYLINNLHDDEIESDDNNDQQLNEVLLFTNSGISCREHLTRCSQPNICVKKDCAVIALRKISGYIKSSIETLDICMFLITSDELCKAIISVYKRGVRLRVISDGEMSSSTGTKLSLLRREGIEVRVRRSAFMMHNKYAIIDKKISMSGSLNWTIQAICENEENFVITSQKNIVGDYIQNFEKLWLSLA